MDCDDVSVGGCSISSRVLSQLIRPKKRVGDVCALDMTAAAPAPAVELHRSYERDNISREHTSQSSCKTREAAPHITSAKTDKCVSWRYEFRR